MSFSAKKLDLVIKYVRSLARKLELSKRRQEMLSKRRQVVEKEGVRCLEVMNAKTTVIRRVKTKTSDWELSSSTYKPNELG